MKMADTQTYAYSSVIRGHHVYKSVWTPVVGKTLQELKEITNMIDLLFLS